MAGSYRHVVSTAEDTAGKLLDPAMLAGMLENPGDVWEAVEEMFGMIWFLASQLSPDNPASAVDKAEKNFRAGIAISPGAMYDVEPYEN